MSIDCSRSGRQSVLPRTIGFWTFLASAASAQVTQLISPGPGAVEEVGISPDGNSVVFTVGLQTLFVRDRTTGITETIVSSSSGGTLSPPSISADGRFVTFASNENLVGDDTNAAYDIFLRDRLRHTTERVSVSSTGRQGNGDSNDSDVSTDGRFVVFTSKASNLVPGDGNDTWDVFVRDRAAGTTERVSVSTSGAEGNGSSYLPSISADGRFVAFASGATNFAPGDANLDDDVFVRDRVSGTTELVSVGLHAQPHWDTVWFPPSMSADGRFVAFDWNDGDSGSHELYVRDLQRGITELVSVSSTGERANDESYGPWITADGRYVVFDSAATNLVPGPTIADMYLRDRLNRTTERVSVDWKGRPGNGASGGWIGVNRHRITPDGRFVAFRSFATDLVPSGGSSNGDAYVYDRSHPEHPTICNPGVSGVMGCPCSNPPSSLDRGCDNSVASGGARLEIGGGEFLSSDSLFFTLTDATPNSTAVLVQAFRPNAGGAVYGQGVRCVGGALTNLYVSSTRPDGTQVVPDFDVTSETVHQRAISAGDPLLPLHTRWYMALYRDPVVLGGCPLSATFNTTPTREVLWLP